MLLTRAWRWLALAAAAGCAGAAGPDEADGPDDAFLAGKADSLAVTAAEAGAVLQLVNGASLAELDQDAGLDARAARNIVAHRDGGDGAPGTGDDDRFDDLAELDDVRYVGPVAFERLLAHAHAVGLVDAGAGCLLISEYLEGQGNYNKAVELFNCGTTPAPLDQVALCLVRDGATTCTRTQPLAGELAAGEVLALCRRIDGTHLDPMPAIAERCQLEAPGVLTFSGNDRLVLFRDQDGSAGLTAGDVVLDAFGHIEVAPSFELWSDTVLRRCRLEPFDGARFFPYLEYFTRHARHDHADYGHPPAAAACP